MFMYSMHTYQIATRCGRIYYPSPIFRLFQPAVFKDNLHRVPWLIAHYVRSIADQRQ